jgi:hypothetical protein
MATIAFGEAYTLGDGQFSIIQLPLQLFKKVLLNTIFLLTLAHRPPLPHRVLSPLPHAEFSNATGSG